MPGIDAETFALFGDTLAEKHADLTQSVRDRILTILNKRQYYSEYGSLAQYHPGQVSILVLKKSIFDALATEPRIQRLEIQVLGRIINVRVNGQITIQIGGG